MYNKNKNCLQHVVNDTAESESAVNRHTTEFVCNINHGEDRWPMRQFPKTSNDNIFIRDIKGGVKASPFPTEKQKLRNHNYILLAPRRKKHTF